MPKLKINNRKVLRRQQWMPNVRSRKSKFALSGLIIIAILSLSLLVLPYLPKLRFLLFRPKVDASAYVAAVEKKSTPEKPAAVNPPPIKEVGNRLVIPSIGLNTQIFDGPTIRVISKDQGVWRESGKTNPTVPGNMVIAGHRWMYTPTIGGRFYDLPELKNGDKLYVRWNDKVFEYQVYDHKTVNPTQVDIRDIDPSVPYKLTMYTCHPLGSVAKRFVIEAKLIQ